MPKGHWIGQAAHVKGKKQLSFNLHMKFNWSIFKVEEYCSDILRATTLHLTTHDQQVL